MCKLTPAKLSGPRTINVIPEPLLQSSFSFFLWLSSVLSHQSRPSLPAHYIILDRIFQPDRLHGICIFSAVTVPCCLPLARGHRLQELLFSCELDLSLSHTAPPSHTGCLGKSCYEWPQTVPASGPTTCTLHPWRRCHLIDGWRVVYTA